MKHETGHKVETKEPKDPKYSEYTYEQKSKLVDRIENIKKLSYVQDIYDIIKKYNTDIKFTETSSYEMVDFNNLDTITYHVIEKYLRKIKKKNKSDNSAAKTSESSEIALCDTTIKYSEEDDNIYVSNTKLRYSNQEKNLVKRKIYEKCISDKSNNNIFVKKTNHN